MKRATRVRLLRIRRELVCWWQSSNVINRTWWRMRHPVLHADTMRRVRLLQNGRGYLDA